MMNFALMSAPIKTVNSDLACHNNVAVYLHAARVCVCYNSGINAVDSVKYYVFANLFYLKCVQIKNFAHMIVVESLAY